MRIQTKFIAALTLAAVSFALAGCGSKEVVEEKAAFYLPQVVVTKISTGLSREIATTGQVQAEKSTTLAAPTGADVVSVSARPGDTVARGQLLLTLSDETTANNFQQAKNGLANAKQSLTETRASGEKSIAAAKVALESAEAGLASTLASNEKTRLQAEEGLDTTKISTDLAISAAETGLQSAINSAYPTAQTVLTSADQLIGVSDFYEYQNDAFETYIGVYDTETKRFAENRIRALIDKIEEPVTDYDSARELLVEAESVSDAMLDVMNNTASSAVLTQKMIDGHIATFTTQLSTVRGAISGLDAAKNSLASAEQDSNGSSQSVLSAEASYEATLAQLESAKVSARSAVASAEAALASAQRGAELSRLQAESGLNSAQTGYNNALVALQDLEVRADFAGQVVDIFVEKGDQVAPGAQLVTVENTDQLKIVAYLSSENAKKLSVGDTVKIATASQDQIHAISSSADPLTKKYKIEILHKNPYLSAGQFVKLRFQLDSTAQSTAGDGKIWLPLTAIQILANESFVWSVNKENQTVKKVITLGEIAGKFVEVTSGLEVGEKVVVTGGRIIEKAGTAVEITEQISN